MIKPRTVFVIGAGGSCSYGLPSGEKLAVDARALKEGDDVYRLIATAFGHQGTVAAVVRDLKQHTGESIDAFLEHRQHLPDTMKIGKALIAVLLGRATSRPANVDRGDDWIAHVIRKMTKGAPRPQGFIDGNTGVQFVTFNFDSVIEDHIRDALHRAYKGEPIDEISRAAASVRVTHVHGQLPAVPHGPLSDSHQQVMTIDGPVLPQINKEWIPWTLEAVDRIELVLDEIDSNLLQAVQSDVRDAEVLCFLGFQYEKGNLTKLGIPERLKHDMYMQAFGSAFHLDEGDRRRLSAIFGKTTIDLGDREQKNLDVLRQFDILRD